MATPVNITPPSLTYTSFDEPLIVDVGTWTNSPILYVIGIEYYVEEYSSWFTASFFITPAEENPAPGFIFNLPEDNELIISRLALTHKLRLGVGASSEPFQNFNFGNAVSNEVGPINSDEILFTSLNNIQDNSFQEYIEDNFILQTNDITDEGPPLFQLNFEGKYLKKKNNWSPGYDYLTGELPIELNYQLEISDDETTWEIFDLKTQTINNVLTEEDLNYQYDFLRSENPYLNYGDKYFRLNLEASNENEIKNFYSQSFQIPPASINIKQNPFIIQDLETNYLHLYNSEEYPFLNFEINGSDIDEINYQWQVSVDDVIDPDNLNLVELYDGDWEDIEGETNTSLEIDIESEYPLKLIRLKVGPFNFPAYQEPDYVYSNNAMGTYGEKSDLSLGDYPIGPGYPEFIALVKNYYGELINGLLESQEANKLGLPLPRLYDRTDKSSCNEQYIIAEISDDNENWEEAPENEFLIETDQFGSYKLVQQSELQERYVRMKIVYSNFKGIEERITDSFFMTPLAPDLSDYSISLYKDESGTSITGELQPEPDYGFGYSFYSEKKGFPSPEFNFQWQASADKLTWYNIEDQSIYDPSLYLYPNIEYYYKGQYIRLVASLENEYGSAKISSAIEPFGLEPISLIETEPTWKFVLYDYQGNALGELVDINNINLDLGINKNPSLSFDTTLESPLGKTLADGLTADDPLFYVNAWRLDPFEENPFYKYKLQFSGIIFSMEEKGTDNNPTIGITAVGPYYQLTKRIANDEKNDGRRQSGIKPTDDRLLIFVAANNKIVVYDASDGSFVREWGEFGTDPGQFWSAFGVDTSENKYVYVADKNNDRIQKFDLEGNFILEWNQVEDEDNLLEDPVDVAVDPITREVWVADKTNKQLVKYTADGEFIFKVPAQTNCPMDDLSSVYVDYEGNVYFTDKTSLTTNPNNQGVYKVKPTGEIIVETTGIINSAQKKFAIDGSGQTYWVNLAGRLRRGSGRPKLTSKATTMLDVNDGESLTIGPDKSIYFLRGNATIYKYNAANNISLQFTDESRIGLPRSLALARDGGKDSIELVSDIIEYSNTENNGGLIDPPSSWSPGPNVFIEPGSLGGYRSISSIIEEFNDNYEWRIEPDFNLDDGIKLGSMKIEPVLGENKFVNDSIVFEYGFGKHNVNEYTIKKSIENLANIINYPAADQVPYNISGTSPDLIEKIGVFEDVVSGNILSKDLRKNLIDLHLYYRTSPRTMVEITPSRSDTTGPDDSRTPIPLLQYHLGDVIGIGIQENGEYRIDPVEARIYDIQIQIDSEGQETATLNLYFDA